MLQISLQFTAQIKRIHIWTVAYSVEPVLKDHLIGYKKVVFHFKPRRSRVAISLNSLIYTEKFPVQIFFFQEKFSLVGGSIILKT